MYDQEIWKEIPGWEGLYSVSDKGKVRSEKRTIDAIRRDGWEKQVYTIPERILKPSIQPTGHLRVSLSKNSKIKYRMIHSLVLLAFIGIRPLERECCHIDGNPANNNLSNLYYGTRSQNISDAKKHGTFPMGINRPGALINPTIAKEIYNLSKNGMKSIDIAKKFNLTRACVVQVTLGNNWKEHTGGEKIDNSLYKYNKISEEHKKIIMNIEIPIMKAASIVGINRHTASKWRKKFNNI
jgi:hypothetical protein